MKLKYSLFTRRQFLNGLFGGWIAAFLGSLIYPVVRFIFPPSMEPDEVFLPLTGYADMAANTTRNFAWGSKPGILRKNEDGSFSAFIGVCTHLDCTITYLPEKKSFFCACHDGWYDENGKNIGGPPPRPLDILHVRIHEDKIIITRETAR